MLGVGVLADVHRREVQAERRERAHRALERAAGDELAAVREQRVAHEHQVGEQLARAEVVAARLVRAALGDALRACSSSFTRMHVSFRR